MGQAEYLAEVERCGVNPVALSRKERGASLQAWREVYAAACFAATGKWRHGPFDWHVFSFDYTRAIHGVRAVAVYQVQPLTPFLVMPEDGRWPAYRCDGSRWPDFGPLGLDVYVWPTDLSWTMAFTHEAGIGIGPYFSWRAWAGQGTWGGGSPRYPV